MNKIRLDGKVATEPEFSHECKGEKFYKLFLEVGRKSEVVDTFPCMVPEVFLKDFEVGECIGINGEIRTRNNHSEGNRKVEIYVFVLGVYDYEGQDSNSVELEGYVCKEPIYRETPLGRAISDLLIASNRNGKANANSAMMSGNVIDESTSSKPTPIADISSIFWINESIRSISNS